MGWLWRSGCRWLRDQVRSSKDADRVHFFNSFFYKKLTENNGGRTAERPALGPA